MRSSFPSDDQSPESTGAESHEAKTPRGCSARLPRVAIVLVNWNGWEDTVECLESLQRLTYANRQVIVVDNGSTDESIERIKAWAQGRIPVRSRFFTEPGPKPMTVVEYGRDEAEGGGLAALEASIEATESARRLVLIRNGTNLGFAGGTNVGLRYALKRGYEYLGPLNNDTVVPPDYLARLIATLESHGEFAAISPKILYKDDPARIFWAGGGIRLWRSDARYLGYQQADADSWRGIRRTDFVSGCCFIARRELVESIGCFDEDFFFGYEEVAYSYAAVKRGFSLGVNLDVVIHHKHGSSYGGSERFRIYYNTKYHLLLLKKHGTAAEQALGFFFYFLMLAKSIPVWIIKGQARLIPGALCGVLDFVRGQYRRARPASSRSA